MYKCSTNLVQTNSKHAIIRPYTSIQEHWHKCETMLPSLHSIVLFPVVFQKYNLVLREALCILLFKIKQFVLKHHLSSGINLPKINQSIFVSFSSGVKNVTTSNQLGVITCSARGQLISELSSTLNSIF